MSDDDSSDSDSIIHVAVKSRKHGKRARQDRSLSNERDSSTNVTQPKKLRRTKASSTEVEEREKTNRKSRQQKVLSPQEQCLHVARWIPRGFDMFCDLGEAIKISILLDEDNNDENEDDEDSKRRKNVVQRIDAGVQARYRHIYYYIEECAPYLLELLRNKKRRQEFDALISEMGKMMWKVRSDDASQLKKAIGIYVAPCPDKKGLEPPLGSDESHSRMGFHHPELARLLCPIKHLSAFLTNPGQTRKDLQEGHITAISAKWPAFLYCGDIAGEDFDLNRFDKGFLRGYVLIRVLKHIFIAPSSALSKGKVKSTRPGNGKLHEMHEVTAEHIAYAAVHTRYSLASREKWKQHDGVFDYADFYYRILNFLTFKADKIWCSSLYGYLNKELFGDERGVMDGHTKNICSDEDNLAMMEKQIAACLNSPTTQNDKDLPRMGTESPPPTPRASSPTGYNDHTTRTTPPPSHSSVTPIQSPPPRWRRGSRAEPQCADAPRDSPLTDIGDNRAGDKDIIEQPSGNKTGPQAAAISTSSEVPTQSHKVPTKKKGRKSHK